MYSLMAAAKSGKRNACLFMSEKKNRESSAFGHVGKNWKSILFHLLGIFFRSLEQS